MTITQTVDIPENRWLNIKVPNEIPAGRTIIAFTPAAPVDALSRGEALLQKAGQMAEAEKIAQINRHADQLNEEVLDVLLDQDTDSFDDDFERLASLDIAVMRGTAVQFNCSDIVIDRDNIRLDPTAGADHPK